MTRLMLNGKEVSSLIERCIYEAENKIGGFILSKNMKKVELKDLANKISSKIEIIGLRPGEELHENLISKRELKFTKVDNDYIFIYNKKTFDKLSQLKSPLSSKNALKMSSNELIDLIAYVEKKMLNTMNY